MSKTGAAGKAEVRALRSEWRTWRRGTHPPLHPGFCLVCPTKCGEPGCEACAATAYRVDRLGEIEQRAATLTGATL